jgi:hypothetical protein
MITPVMPPIRAPLIVPIKKPVAKLSPLEFDLNMHPIPSQGLYVTNPIIPPVVLPIAAPIQAPLPNPPLCLVLVWLRSMAKGTG